MGSIERPTELVPLVSPRKSAALFVSETPGAGPAESTSGSPIYLAYYVKTASPDVMAAMSKLEQSLAAQKNLDTIWTPAGLPN